MGRNTDRTREQTENTDEVTSERGKAHGLNTQEGNQVKIIRVITKA